MIRPIVIWPDKVLSTPTRAVSGFDDALHALLQDMAETMHEEKGIGIAANQIGVSLRVAIVGKGDGELVEMVNPVILERSEPIALPEGCLSVPGEEEQVKRFRRVEVTYQDRQGRPHRAVAEGRFAHVIQHEVDHLDGLVYVNHLSGLKRDMIRRKMLKLQRAGKTP